MKDIFKMKNIAKIIFVILLTKSLVAFAEVRETEFGKAEGYPFAFATPFRLVPQFRVGGFTGKGLTEIENRVPPFWMTPEQSISQIPVHLSKSYQQSDAQRLMEKNPITAMLLIKNGSIVFEGYQYGSTADTLFDSQSIAKTFTALAIGTLIDDGLLKSTNEKMGDLVPALKESPIGRATVRQTLQMTCGHKFKFTEDGQSSTAGEYLTVKYAFRGRGSKNIYDYYKTLEPLEPGSVFSYDPHCSDALSMLVTQLTGKNLREYFGERIWKRLGPQKRVAWLSPTLHPELTSGANGYYSSLRDYGRLALLFLNEGKHNENQIISKQWMKLMHTDTVDVGDYPSNFKRYGYQTWIKEKTQGSWFAGLGLLGQRFYIDIETKSAMLIFALDYSHVPSSDAFWERFKR